MVDAALDTRLARIETMFDTGLLPTLFRALRSSGTVQAPGRPARPIDDVSSVENLRADLDGRRFEALLSTLHGLSVSASDHRLWLEGIAHHEDNRLTERDLRGAIAEILALQAQCAEISHEMRTYLQERASFEVPVVAPPRLPRQKAAPIRTALKHGRVGVLTSDDPTGPMNAAGVGRLRVGAAEVLASALAGLSTLNVDRRVVAALEPLLRHLELQEFSVEALGLQFEIAVELRAMVAEQTEGVALVQLDRALKATNVVLSRFEEWRIFKAAEVGLDISVGSTIALAREAESLSQHLTSQSGSDLVDAEIALRLHEMAKPLLTQSIRYEVTSYPLVASLSNVFATLAEAVLQASDLAEHPPRACCGRWARWQPA